MSLQRVTSFRRRAQVNAPDASCPRRRRAPRLDESIVQRGVGGGACNAPLSCLKRTYFTVRVQIELFSRHEWRVVSTERR